MKLIGQYDVRFPGDKGESCINSMAIMPNRQVVLVDLGNVSLKLLDAQLSPLASHTFVTSDPWDITCVSETEVAVTLPEANRVQVISVAGETIEVKDNIDVGMWCTGIAYVEDKHDGNGEFYLYVMGGYEALKYIGCFTLAGTMMRTIKIDETLFKQPQFLSYNAATGHVFISDWQKGVIGFSDPGSDGCMFQAESNRHYWGVAQDAIGNVYIGSHKQNGIITAKHIVKKVEERSTSASQSTDDANDADTNVCEDTSKEKETEAKDTGIDISTVMDMLGINVGARMRNTSGDMGESVSSCYMAAARFKLMDAIAFETTFQCSHTPENKGKSVISKVSKERKAKPSKGQLNKMQIKGRQITVSAHGKKGAPSSQTRKGEESTSKVAETKPANHVTETELEPRALLYRSHNNTLVVSSFGASRNVLYVYKL